jgi:hypothetical protein
MASCSSSKTKRGCNWAASPSRPVKETAVSSAPNVVALMTEMLRTVSARVSGRQPGMLAGTPSASSAPAPISSAVNSLPGVAKNGSSPPTSHRPNSFGFASLTKTV